MESNFLQTTDPLEVLRKLGGYYECPMDKNGKRLGPLVGYAGRYDGTDGKKLQFVGDIYANFAVAEEDPSMFLVWSEVVRKKIKELFGYPKSRWTICAAPMGGLAFGTVLAASGEHRYIFPEKKVTTLVTETEREKSELVFSRHQVREGDQVIIVEDVCNNFSTTHDLIELVNRAGGSVLAIACLLNRSTKYDDHFGKVPIISLVRKPIEEYLQDDPAVAEDVKNGNVIWKPKDDWAPLAAAMERHKAA